MFSVFSINLLEEVIRSLFVKIKVILKSNLKEGFFFNEISEFNDFKYTPEKYIHLLNLFVIINVNKFSLLSFSNFKYIVRNFVYKYLYFPYISRSIYF